MGWDNIVKRRLFANIPPIEQRVYPHSLETLLGAFFNEGIQVIDVGMDIAIREETYEMNGAPLSRARHNPRPTGPDPGSA